MAMGDTPTGGGGDGGGFEILQLLGLQSSGEIDHSAPLSATDLQVLIDRTQKRSEHSKDRVYRYIKSHHQDFLLTVSRASDSASRFADIVKDLEAALELLEIEGARGHVAKVENEALPVCLELCQLVEEARKGSKVAEERRRALAVVESISQLHQKLILAEQGFSQGRLMEAAQALCDLKNSLDLPADWCGEPDNLNKETGIRAFSVLRESWARCFLKLQTLLEELLFSAVVIDGGNLKLCVIPCVDGEARACGLELAGAQLSAVLSAMDRVGVLDVAFAKIADAVFKTVIKPILDDPLKIQISEETDATKKAVLSLDLSCNPEEAEVLAVLYAKLLKVVTFLHCHLCCGCDAWMTRLGQMTWPRLAEGIIAGYLLKAIPSEVADVEKFQKLAALTKIFETALSRVKFIPELGLEGNKLGKFASDVEIHFASKKKKRLLARTRRLLVRSDFNVFSNKTLRQVSKESRLGTPQNISEEHVVELLFQPETCAISWAAKQLMEVVHEALQDACMSTTKTALEFYHGARDSLSLYCAIVPVKLAKQLNTLSFEAIVCHNDCLYLSNEIAGLAYQYRDVLLPKLKNAFVFVDFVTLFRQKADGILRQQIHLIECSLDQALDQANGFRNTDKTQYFDMASLAIEQAVFMLEKVRMLWQPIVMQSIYRKGMGFLINLVFMRVASEILGLDDMDVEETIQLRKLIFFLEESLSPMFQTLVGDVASRHDGVECRNRVEIIAPAWCKLMRLAELLDMSLISITQAWESGNLSMCGFSFSEVQKLIKAVFSDTDIRKESLRRIATT